MDVLRPVTKFLSVFLLVCALFAQSATPAQRERQVPPPEPDEDAYGSRFFDQLRSIFGKFQNSDLLRAFQAAEPIQCSELVVGKGTWRTVAFFNEDRSLGEWCRDSIDQVKTDLTAYTFKGSCRGDQGSIQITTEFPVGDSINAYNEHRIDLDQVDVNVNAPVSVVYDSRTQAYVFELPYLFLIGHRPSGNIYSLDAQHVNDSYARDVSSRWECKAVKSGDVTYRFLICRTATVARKTSMRSGDRAFGASAYFILSDGAEATTSVNLTFGGSAHPAENPRDTARPSGPTLRRPSAQPAAQPAAPPPESPAAPPAVSPPPPAPIVPETSNRAATWGMPDAGSKVADLGKGQFRLRFSPQTWKGKLDSSELLFDQKISSPLSAWPKEGADYCSWHPGDTGQVGRLVSDEPDAGLVFTMQTFDKSSHSAASILMGVRTPDGVSLGTLQCFFPRAQSMASVDLDHWVSIVGAHLTLEIRR
jgi:hypothetical protein